MYLLAICASSLDKCKPHRPLEPGNLEVSPEQHCRNWGSTSTEVPFWEMLVSCSEVDGERTEGIPACIPRAPP